jgi:hypothetical protein
LGGIVKRRNNNYEDEIIERRNNYCWGGIVFKKQV